MNEVTINVTEVVDNVQITVVEQPVDISVDEIVENVTVTANGEEHIDITVQETIEEVTISVTEGGGGGTAQAYKIHTQPTIVDNNGELLSYTGFSLNLGAATSAAEWAVKKQPQESDETWAGRNTYDQILDNYLSLTYS